jgi:dolichol-phosphate mannosyltransferase
MMQWLGFRTACVDVQHGDRYEGKSAYTLMRLLRLAVDGMLSFTGRPLLLSIVTGFAFALLAVLYSSYLLCRLIFVGRFGVPGWVSVTLLVAFLGGLILMSIGMIGLYVNRIYQQVKYRPLYVIDATTSGFACEQFCGIGLTMEAACGQRSRGAFTLEQP